MHTEIIIIFKSLHIRALAGRQADTQGKRLRDIFYIVSLPFFKNKELTLCLLENIIWITKNLLNGEGKYGSLWQFVSQFSIISVAQCYHRSFTAFECWARSHSHLYQKFHLIKALKKHLTWYVKFKTKSLNVSWIVQ